MTQDQAIISLKAEADRAITLWRYNHPDAGVYLDSEENGKQWGDYSVVWDAKAVAQAGACRLGRLPCRIKLSLKYFKVFGYERSRGTLLHELAHYIVWTVWKMKGHGGGFKRVCAELGGTMNSQMAGAQYADNATSQYLIPARKIKYTCRCSIVVTRSRRFTVEQMNRRSCRVCRTKLVDWQCSVNTDCSPIVVGGK